MTLLELNKGVGALAEQAAALAGTGAVLVAEDLSRPILRPSVKVELEDSTAVRATQSRAEQTVRFRIYYFARDKDRPKLENLAMRQALGEVFRDGVPAGGHVLPIDEGLSFSVVDGVLTAALELEVNLELPETGEPMETLHQNLEVD